MSLGYVARPQRPAGTVAGTRQAATQERRWVGFFTIGFAALWMASPGYPAAGVLTFLFSLGLLISAMRRVAALEVATRGGGEPGFVDHFFAGGLMASLLWNAAAATGWISDKFVPQDVAGLLPLCAASLVTMLVFCCLVICESIVSYLALRTVGAGRTDMAADVAFALHVEAKFGGLAGRLRR